MTVILVRGHSRAIAMRMTPALRKLALTAHVSTSIGWLGAVASFLVLSLAGLTSDEVDIVRSAYLAMDLIGRYAIVPLSIAALATGIVQSIGTSWGLFRHYWIVAKLVLTIGATLLLLLHQFTAVAGAAKRVASTPPGMMPDVGRWGTQLVGDAAAAVLVLLAITAIAVFKPWGLTPYGRRKQLESSTAAAGGPSGSTSTMPLSLMILLVAIGLAIVAFILLHLAGGGLGHHGH